MKLLRRGRPTWAVVVLALSSCATPQAPLPSPPLHPNGQALWLIIHDQCVPERTPCALVSLQNGEARGFVVLKDRVGASQYLLMPTAKISGIEDPALLEPEAANYFADAWDQRHFVDDRLGHSLKRDQVSIAVNSMYGRSQDQLHLHIDCLDAAVGVALGAMSLPPTGSWNRHALQLKGHRYRIRWLDAGELGSKGPFKILAETMPGARHTMAAWTIAVVGAVKPDGSEGYYLLADRANPSSGDFGSAEELQDHACKL